MITIPMTVESSAVEFEMGIGASYELVSNPIYDGAYEFTPTQETQVVECGGKAMSGDITINPIPNNYGLITWDGSVLTVS